MGEIKPLNKGSIKTIEDIFRMAEDGKVRGVVVAGFTVDGEVVTGYSQIDVCQMATLIGHLQVDMMKRFIDATYITN